MSLLEGTVIGEYEVLSPLGAGGMGEVYRAFDRKLGREVALKILPESMASDPDALRRFEREARAVAALSHPNVLAIHNFGNEAGRAYAVMELLEGESLDRLLARERISWRKAVEIASAVAAGLAVGHARGIVHRDIKPANIFVTSDGQVKILDFGLAKKSPLASLSEAPTMTVVDEAAAASPLTGPGTVMGTVGYMAPEQIRGEAADARSDVFSLGCVLYEMLAGQRAFRGATAPETLAAILRDPAPEIPAATGALPGTILPLLRRCLEKRPEERFQSAQDLAFSLREAVSRPVESIVIGASPGRADKRKWLWPVGALATLLGLVAVVATLLQRSKEAPGLVPAGSRIRSIAVLPLANLSGDPGEEYFADGMTEQLIAELATIPGLRVTSRSSSMSYKGRAKPVAEIARELSVDAVLEGSVARSPGRLKVGVQLVDPATDSHLWVRSYDRDASDVVALQGEIAEAVAGEIDLEVDPARKGGAEKRRGLDPAAFDAFVKGRYFWHKRGEGDLLRAIEHFRAALDVDPTYANAYAGLADAYSQLGYLNAQAPRDAFPKAKAAALKALELEPDLAAAHSALGFIHMYFDWDFAAADAQFRRAIEIDPNSVTARHAYSVYLAAMLRPAEARKEVEVARQLDPLSVLVATDMGFELYYARDYELAIVALRDAIELNPSAPIPHFWLARTYQALGRYDEALEEYRAGGQGIAGWPPALAGVGHLRALLGQRAEALAVLAQLETAAQRGYVSPYCTALVHLGLGDKEQTMRWLERSYEERANWMVWLLRDPRWDPMRAHPPFRALFERIGFPTARGA